MKTLFIPFLVGFVILCHPSSANAALCPQCKGKNFIQSIGACGTCQAVTSSGAFKLCPKCSDKLAQCEACQITLKPKADARPDLEVKPVPATEQVPKPKSKAYPAHWGAVPRIQTKDIRQLPGGYGMGSSTLAAWIQKNLDEDAKAPQAAKDQKADAAGNTGEIRQVEKKIADMEDFAKRARFTAEGLKKHEEELAALRERLKTLKGESGSAPK